MPRALRHKGATAYFLSSASTSIPVWKSRQKVDAVDTRLCREKYGAETIEGLMLKWGRAPACPACGQGGCWLDGASAGGRARYRCPACGRRFNALSGTVFANAKLPLHKIMRIVA